MMKLLKYELLRKKKVYVIILSIMVVLIALVAIGIPRLENDYWILVVAISTMILLVGSGLFPFIINVVNYYGDFKSKNGYMMFLTPNNGYKIFGSKILAALIDVVLVLVVLFAFGFMAYQITMASYGAEIQPMLDSASAQITAEFPGLSLSRLLIITASTAILQGLAGIILALMTITVSKTLLAQRSLNWIVPILLFIVFSFVEQSVMSLTIAAFNFNDITELIVSDTMTMDLATVMLTGAALYAVFAGIYTAISATLINKKLDL